MKLTITNFQSISHAVLEYNTGITAIVGCSNSGKTATVRALYSLLRNPPEAKSFIKTGEDRAEVELEMEGLIVRWIRTPKESSYEINGVLYQKVGRTDLFELLPNNGFYMDDDNNILNIQDEWSSMFPFDRTDSQVYKLFEDIFAVGEGDSTVVMKKIKDDESEAKRKIAEINSKLTSNRVRLEKIESFLNSHDVSELSVMRGNLQKLLTEYEQLDNDCNFLMGYLRSISNISKVRKIDFDFTLIDNYLRMYEDTELLIKSMDIINKNLVSEEFNFSIINSYLQLNEDVKKLVTINKFLSVDTVKKPKLDFEMVYSYLELVEDCGSLTRILKELKDLSEEEKNIQDNLLRLKGELNSMGTCPLCGQDVKEIK